MKKEVGGGAAVAPTASATASRPRSRKIDRAYVTASSHVQKQRGKKAGGGRDALARENIGPLLNTESSDISLVTELLPFVVASGHE
jgi:hypothetical protein